MANGASAPEGISEETWRQDRHCPFDLLDAPTLEWMQMHSWLVRDGGGLWYPGSVGEQPARDLRALEVLGGELGRLQRERLKAEAPSSPSGAEP